MQCEYSTCVFYLKSTADVILNASNGVNINMVDASGSFGYVINGGSSTLEGSILMTPLQVTPETRSLVTMVMTQFCQGGDDIIKLSASGRMICW